MLSLPFTASHYADPALQYLHIRSADYDNKCGTDTKYVGHIVGTVSLLPVHGTPYPDIFFRMDCKAMIFEFKNGVKLEDSRCTYFSALKRGIVTTYLLRYHAM